MTEPIKVVGPEYLVPLVHRSVETIKRDAYRSPESLPPRMIIPGSKKLLWLESMVYDWFKELAEQCGPQPERKVSIFPGRKSTRART